MQLKTLVILFLLLIFSSSAKATPYLYLADSVNGQVLVYDIDSDTTISLVDSIEVESKPEAIAISPDGNRLYVANKDSWNVSVIDTATNTKITDVFVGREPSYIIFEKNGDRVFVASKSLISIIDTEKVGVEVNPVIEVLNNPNTALTLAITENGDQKRLYSINNDSTISIFDISGASSRALPPFSFSSISRMNKFEKPLGIATKDDFLYVAHNEQGTKNGYITVFQENSTGLRYDNSFNLGADTSPQHLLIAPSSSHLFVTLGNGKGYERLSIENYQIKRIEPAHSTSYFTWGLSLTPDSTYIYKVYFPSTSKTGSIYFSDDIKAGVQHQLSNPNIIKSNTVGNFISPAFKAIINAKPSSIDFGSQDLKSTVVEKKITLTYQFVESKVTSIRSNSDDFSIIHNCSVGNIKSLGTVCSITVTMNSDKIGNKTGSIIIESNASNSSLEVPLKGNIRDPNSPPTPPTPTPPTPTPPTPTPPTPPVPTPDTDIKSNEGNGGCALITSKTNSAFGLSLLFWFTSVACLYYFKKVKRQSL